MSADSSKFSFDEVWHVLTPYLKVLQFKQLGHYFGGLSAEFRAELNGKYVHVIVPPWHVHVPLSLDPKNMVFMIYLDTEVVEGHVVPYLPRVNYLCIVRTADRMSPMVCRLTFTVSPLKRQNDAYLAEGSAFISKLTVDQVEDVYRDPAYRAKIWSGIRAWVDNSIASRAESILQLEKMRSLVLAAKSHVSRTDLLEKSMALRKEIQAE